MHNIKRFHLSEEAKQQKRQKEADKIKQYRTLNDTVLKAKQDKIYNQENFKKTTDLLSLNPEYYTIWNYRRDIFTNLYVPELSKEELIKLLEKELMFTIMNMKLFPKVYWIWNHRVWVLENHPTPNYDNELLIVNKMLNLDPRNFHGWHYRRFVINKLEIQSGKSLSLQEFEYTTSKINNNFSNFSAWHNRTKLIPILFDLKPTQEFESRLNFLKKELVYLQNAMYTDPDDQSIWIYLRWLLTSDVFIKGIENSEYLEILNQQLSIVKELNELELDDDGKDNNWCLKTIVTIETLIMNVDKDVDYTEEVKGSLTKLISEDPLRANLYKDKLL